MRVAPPMARVMSWVSDRPRRTPRRVSRENFTGTSSPAVCRSLFVTLIVYSFGGRGAGGGDCFGGGGDGSVLGGRGAGLDGGAAAGVAGGGGVCAAASAVCSPWVPSAVPALGPAVRSEEHTSELQSRGQLVCRLLLEKKRGSKLEGLPVLEAPGSEYGLAAARVWVDKGPELLGRGSRIGEIIQRTHPSHRGGLRCGPR